MRRIGLGCIGVMALAAPALALSTAEAGREVFAANKDAVITARIVSSVSFGGDENERENESNALVIRDDGLAVLSLYALDPTAVWAAMGRSPGEVVAKVKSVEYIMPDGTEVPAEVILRDKDLDLAYIRPIEKPAEPMPHVDITQGGTAKLLEELVFIAQQGKVVRRAHVVFVQRVEAVIEKPRLLYLTGEDRQDAIFSAPAFTLDGAFVGIGALRAINSEAAGGAGNNVMVVIVPAADIARGAEQAPPFE